ncbi:MAG: M1 family metallopeptidase [Gemmatimonadota bacterium]
MTEGGIGRRKGGAPTARGAGLLLRLAGAALPAFPLLFPAAGVAQNTPLGVEPPPVAPAVAPPVGAYAPEVDVLHYDVEVAVSDTASWLEGRTRIRLVARVSDPLLRLDLTGMAVSEMRVQNARVIPTIHDGVVEAPLRAAAGDTLRIFLAYRGVPDDGLFIGPNLHGSPSAFADNWPNRARFWLPSVDHPSDKATVRFTVHAPAAWEVVANGALQGDPAPTPLDAPGPPGPRRTWVWETGAPIPTYTMVIGAAEMVHATVGTAACGAAPLSPREDGCVEVSWWAFPPDSAQAARAFGRAAEMVEFFTSLVGPFPYEKLANVQSGTRFGGMENSSAIFYSGEAVARGRDMEGTVAHEIAHQWFGDSVTESQWSNLWLSEGFATYFGHLFFERGEGVDALRAAMERDRQVLIASGDAARPVVARYENLYDLLNRNSYQKGGWVLHMLRGVLGDETFFRGIRAYYRSYAGANATTRDLQSVLEAESGRDLEWFFHEWLFEPGYPEFQVSVEPPPDSTNAVASVTIRQVQNPAWPRFRMPVALEWTRGGAVHHDTVEVSGAETRVLLRAPAAVGASAGAAHSGDPGLREGALPAPPRVILDPDGWVLKGAVRYR